MKKTILATAISTAFLMIAAGSANATVIDRDFITGIEGSTKFVDSSNTDGTLEIKTDSDARKFLSELSTATTMDEIRAALAQIDGDGHAVLMGVAGGSNIIDDTTNKILTLACYTDKSIKRLQNQFIPGADLNFNAGTNINIGGEGVTPLIVGLTGADNIINAGLDYQLVAVGSEAPSVDSYKSVTTNIVRTGNTNINSQSGNLVGLIGGNFGLNIQGIDVNKKKVNLILSSKFFPGHT